MKNSCLVKQLKGIDVEFKIEAYVAKIVYGLDKEEFVFIVNSFQKLKDTEREKLLMEYQRLEGRRTDGSIGKVKIFNHLSSSLSEMDMTIVRSVPAGGNWKNIPEDIPSKEFK